MEVLWSQEYSVYTIPLFSKFNTFDFDRCFLINIKIMIIESFSVFANPIGERIIIKMIIKLTFFA